MNQQNLNTLANVFGVCFLLGSGLLLLTFGAIVGLHDWVYSIHTRWFDLTPEAFDLAIYSFLALIKTLILVLFLIPWAALKIMARRSD